MFNLGYLGFRYSDGKLLIYYTTGRTVPGGSVKTPVELSELVLELREKLEKLEKGWLSCR